MPVNQAIIQTINLYSHTKYESILSDLSDKVSIFIFNDSIFILGFSSFGYLQDTQNSRPVYFKCPSYMRRLQTDKHMLQISPVAYRSDKLNLNVTASSSLTAPSALKAHTPLIDSTLTQAHTTSEQCSPCQKALNNVAKFLAEGNLRESSYQIWVAGSSALIQLAEYHYIKFCTSSDSVYIFFGYLHHKVNALSVANASSFLGQYANIVL